MPAPRADERQRRVQQRALDTRELLFRTTVQVLCEGGYAGFSTLAVGEAAGVSRGRLVHHFPTKAALVEATLGYLLDRYAERVPRDVHELRDTPREARTLRALDMLWGLKRTPEYQACLELIIGTRTDPELRDAVAAFERRLDSLLTGAVHDLVGSVADRPGFSASVLTAIQAMRGILLTSRTGAHDLDAEWAEVRPRLALLFAEFR